MPDRDMVINALKYCAPGTNSCNKCPMGNECKGLINKAMIAAIELLKEQEAVNSADKPTDALSMIDEYRWKHTMGKCGNCKAPLPALEGLRSKFCWMCGKAVKWDA